MNPSNFNAPTMYVSTDAAGNIFRWHIYLETPEPTSVGEPPLVFLQTLRSQFITGSMIAQDYVITYQICDSGPCFDRGKNELNPGVWTLDAPIINTPLPGALPLFATGLAALALLGQRRKKQAT
jgi:hypothetical protein